MEKVKVLITGPVNNDFSSLKTKLSSLQKSKAGPFHVCFCVGPFFIKSNASIEPEEESVYFQKAKEFLEEGAPIPVYFCDVGQVPSGLKLPKYVVDPTDRKDDAEIDLDGADENSSGKGKREMDVSNDENDTVPKGVVEIAKNVYHLHGISHEESQTADILSIYVNDKKQYITVAFMPPNTRMGTPQTAKFEAKTSHPSFVGCDILLTSEWGQGLAGSPCLSKDDVNSLKQNIGDCDLNELGTFDIAEIASKSRPRYHFAPSLFNLNKKTDWYDSSLFLQSLPYTNPPSALSSGVIKNYHTSRFLSLCPVVEAKRAKAGGKKKKYIHALGIQPLWTMDRVTATEVPKNTVVVSNPYTDEAYGKDYKEKQGNAGNKFGSVIYNAGLSEAQTRRIMGEENNNDQYRWNVANRKRPLNSITPTEVDQTNCTLFLHGLHKDVSRGANLNRDTIFRAFQAGGCTRVRFPGNDQDTGLNGRLHSFCFLDFPTHEQALQCLNKSGGTVEIAGITLDLKWSSGTNRNKFNKNIPPPPPPGFSGIMENERGAKRQRTGLSEAEAMDSSSLFIYIKANPESFTSEKCAAAILNIGNLAQTKLEDAINGEENGERITAEDEPALKVTSRNLASKANCGFLDFASHAAASMALATLTGSTDGGDMLDDFKIDDGDANVQLWWAKKTTPPVEGRHNFQKHHFPLDARTDCWFCLASPTCEKHLIVSLADKSYVTMPKGPVNKNHTLIVTINHGNPEDDGIGAFQDPSPGVVQEIEETKEKLRLHAKDILQKDLLVYERAIPTKGGYHAHVNCIPIEKGLGTKIRETMTSMANAKSKYGDGFELREIQNPDISITSILRNEDDLDGYFYIEVPFGGAEIKRFLYKYKKSQNTNVKFVPVQFGREILASVIEEPKIASWKTCVLSKDEEEEQANEFSKSFVK